MPYLQHTMSTSASQSARSRSWDKLQLVRSSPAPGYRSERRTLLINPTLTSTKKPIPQIEKAAFSDSHR